jgi:hypothetical protein
MARPAVLLSHGPRACEGAAVGLAAKAPVHHLTPQLLFLALKLMRMGTPSFHPLNQSDQMGARTRAAASRTGAFKTLSESYPLASLRNPRRVAS